MITEQLTDRSNPKPPFNAGLMQAVRARVNNSWAEMVVRFIKAMPSHKIVLTHNDLSPRNILVRDGKVVAIVDWELSGFYPDYWEYVKAYFWPDWHHGSARELWTRLLSRLF